MFEEIRERKAGLGYVWIRSESGTTYLCPASAAAVTETLSTPHVPHAFFPTDGFQPPDASAMCPNGNAARCSSNASTLVPRSISLAGNSTLNVRNRRA